MRKTLHFKFLLLLAMMLVGAGNVKAQEQEQNRVLAVDPYQTTLDFWPRTGTLNVVTENFELNVEHDPTYFEWFVCDEDGNYKESDDRPDLYDWITLSFSKDKNLHRNWQYVWLVTYGPIQVEILFME